MAIGNIKITTKKSKIKLIVFTYLALSATAFLIYPLLDYRLSYIRQILNNFFYYTSIYQIFYLFNYMDGLYDVGMIIILCLIGIALSVYIILKTKKTFLFYLFYFFYIICCIIYIFLGIISYAHAT